MSRPATATAPPPANSNEQSAAVSLPRATTRPLTRDEIRHRDLMLARCRLTKEEIRRRDLMMAERRRIAENARRPVRGCK
jgi:hypothetical protein